VRSRRRAFARPWANETLTFFPCFFLYPPAGTDAIAELLDIIRACAETGESLTVDERNLFCVAYKIKAAPLRRASAVLGAIADREAIEAQHGGRGSRSGGPSRTQLAQEARAALAVELRAVCAEVIGLVQWQLLPHASGEAAVLFHKLAGDYSRYLAECASAGEREGAARAAAAAYEAGLALAREQLLPGAQLRLGITLNYSVLMYEVLGETASALEITKEGTLCAS
jgi:14-3-3 protein